MTAIISSNNDVAKINNLPAVFIRFKSNSCPHCISSQGMWDNMVKQLSKFIIHPDCTICEIESEFSDAFKALNTDGTAFEVGGVPAYEFFRNGKQLEIAPVGREPAALLKALEKQKFIKKKKKKTRRRFSRRAGRTF